MEHLTNNATVTLAICALITTLVEIIRYLIKYVLTKKSNKDTHCLSLDQRNQLGEIHSCSTRTFDIINQRDHDGIPLCYFPRGFLELYTKQVSRAEELQHGIIERLIEMTAEHKQIVGILDKIEQRVHND